jgi:2-iminoacetate synthase ThiH
MVIGKISQQGYQPAECRTVYRHLYRLKAAPFAF